MINKFKPQPSVQEADSKCSLSLNIVYRRIDELKPDPANPRRHSKQQIRKIADSIRAFGFNVPVLIDREKNVVAGHGRLLACGELGWSEVPTLCLDHLTPAQARAFRIADNRLTEISEWDDRLLAEQLKELSVLGLERRAVVLGIAEQRLGRREWAVGGYSIADIHLFRLFWRFFNSLHPAPADFPDLSAHYDRMIARPAVQRVLEIESAVGYYLSQ